MQVYTDDRSNRMVNVLKEVVRGRNMRYGANPQAEGSADIRAHIRI